MGVTALDLEYPLEVFSDRDLIAFTYSEERTENHNKLASFFSVSGLNRIDCLTDDLIASLKEPNHTILEVECAVLDASSKRFWFSAYSSELLWCFSFSNSQLHVCELGCPRDEIEAISCDCDKAYLIAKQRNYLNVYEYKHLGDKLILDSVDETSTKQTSWREITESLGDVSWNLRGLSGNMIALTTETSAVLAEM